MASRNQRDLPSACCRDTAVELSVGCFRPGVGRFDVAFPDHEGLQQDWAITVALLPVLRKLPRTTRKNSARQAPDANPGKNQKARIIDNEWEIAAALLVVPPNPAVSRRHRPSRRRP